MPAPHNVDNLLNDKLTPTPVEIVNQEVSAPETPVEIPEKEEKLTYTEQFKRDKEESLAKAAEAAQQTDDENEESELKSDNSATKLEKKTASSEELDDYGNELPKAKVYTEEEVQRMIRDRLSRGRQQEQPQPTPQQVQQAKSDGFEVDPNSSETWEDQLNTFVDKRLEHRLEARQKEEQDRAWQQREQRTQAEFESRFATGIAKYADFEKVVTGKPITNGMMMGARAFNDPAAFIYSAAKTQSAELDRISQLPDMYQQAAEIGKLEERMRKARSLSKAPAPATKTKGDFAAKGDAKVSIDQRIQIDAKRKLARR